MGKNKKNRHRNRSKPSLDDEELDFEKMDMKQLSKYRKKKDKKANRRNALSEAEPSYKLPWCIVETRSKSLVAKEFLYESIGSYIEKFSPLGFRVSARKTAIFFLEKPGKLDSLDGLSNRLQNEDNSPMFFSRSYTATPDIALNAVQLETVKMAISQRYNTDARLLDLTNFHRDPCLIQADVFAPLSSPLVLKQVIKMCMELPGIYALNLSENLLADKTIGPWKNLLIHFETQALCLNNNELKSAGCLDHVSSPHLTELAFEGNKLEGNVSQVLKHSFPGLGSKTPLETPSTGASCSPIDEETVNTYLKTFYQIHDSADRSSLVTAYTGNIKLHFVSKNPALPSGECVGLDQLGHFLKNFPATTHSYDSMVMTVMDKTTEKWAIQVTGVFKIPDVESPLSFTNKMMLIRKNTGLCCTDQMIEIQ